MTKLKSGVWDENGVFINTDLYSKIPVGLYHINGTPTILKHGDKVDGVLVSKQAMTVIHKMGNEKLNVSLKDGSNVPD